MIPCVFLSNVLYILVTLRNSCVFRQVDLNSFLTQYWIEFLNLTPLNYS